MAYRDSSPAPDRSELLVRRRRRTLARFAAALALGGVAFVHAAAPASAAAPVTVDDAVAMSEGEERGINVLANDSDADGRAELTICRLAPAPEDAPYGASIYDNRLHVYVHEDAPDEITITYYACDYQTLVPGTLTITVTHLEPVRVVKLARPGRISVVNPNDARITFWWGNFLIEQIDGVTRVDPHSRKVVRVRGRRVDWFATIGRNIDVGSGSVHPVQPGRARHAAG